MTLKNFTFNDLGVCCSGNWHSNYNCCSDSDGSSQGCNGYNCTTHTKLVCDSPSGSYPRSSGSYTYTCKAKPSRSSYKDCDPNYCRVTSQIDSNPSNQGKCVGREIYQPNPKYLCDPPMGFVNCETVTEKNTEK